MRAWVLLLLFECACCACKHCTRTLEHLLTVVTVVTAHTDTVPLSKWPIEILCVGGWTILFLSLASFDCFSVRLLLCSLFSVQCWVRCWVFCRIRNEAESNNCCTMPWEEESQHRYIDRLNYNQVKRVLLRASYLSCIIIRAPHSLLNYWACYWIRCADLFHAKWVN